MANRVRPLDSAIRSVRADDEYFLVALSMRVFRRYSEDPARMMRRILRRGMHDIAVAVQGEARIGFVAMHVEPLGRDFGPLRRPSVARLDAIAVRPNMVNQGIGGRLLAHAETCARARGAVSISLITAETNVAAQSLFLGADYQMLTVFDGVYTDGQRAFSMFKAL